MNLMCALTGHDWGEFGMNARVLCKRCRRPKVAPVTGVTLIAAERERQLLEEGWTPEHDDAHDSGEIVHAAISYALSPYSDERGWHDASVEPGTKVPTFWPWDDQSWKPTPSDRVRELVKAGALIAAEIDRLQAVAA